MCLMKRLFILAFMLVAAFTAMDVAYAQILLPGSPQINLPPPPLPPPPPKIEVPKIPQMDDMPRQNYLPPRRPSFSDRVTTCLDEAAAAGLGPADRETYTRACANSR
jgi:hypothetical protein